MEDKRRTLVLGALCGGLAAAGGVFAWFCYTLVSAPNAGVIVDGQFRSYQSDPAWMVLLAGSALLVAGAVGALVYLWRKC